tara:strand:+ start:100762 stop:101355 length:594 start_codon:yes stop_codon:yes gene_type:complete
MSKNRGRPRKFNSDEALANALMVFWTNGFAGTSLDQLAEAMQMKRPSIYNAFGDKQALYRAALSAFRERLDRGIQALAREKSLEKGLQRFFTEALDVYTSGGQPLGCLIFCTAPAEAIAHPELGMDVLAASNATDKALKRIFDDAQKTGQLGDHIDTLIAAQLTQATLHSLALRARAGQSRAALGKMATGAVAMICR